MPFAKKVASVLFFGTTATAIFCVGMLLSATPTQAQTSGLQQQACSASLLPHYQSSGIYAENARGEVLFAHRAEQRFVPASTLKIATVAAALDRWGPKHRFTTEFYRAEDTHLIIRGLGDPGIVSEDLPLLAAEIAGRMSEISAVTLDISHFDKNLRVDGVGTSRNPYDAQYGALLVNFNTLNLRRHKDGQVRSAEVQTPITPLAAQLGRVLRPGSTERINLGTDVQVGVRYFWELLSVFLSQRGVELTKDMPIEIRSEIRSEAEPSLLQDAELLFVHHSAKTLTQHAEALLQYSTNFLANQIFLLLGVDTYGPPATAEKGRMALEQFLKETVGLENVRAVEGAGLSRQNRISPKQLVALLQYFQRYQALLPIERDYFRAKTGSLSGVNTLAGYFSLPRGRQVRFAILTNHNVPREQRFEIAAKLRQCLS